MAPHRLSRVLSFTLAMLLYSFLARAQGPSTTDGSGPEIVTEEQQAPRVRPVRKLTPVRRAVQNVLAEERAAVEGLRARIRAAATHDEAIALQHEMAEVKQATEGKVLRLLLQDAREKSRTADIERYERALAEMEAARVQAEAGKSPASVVRTSAR